MTRRCIIALAATILLSINGWGCGWPPPPERYSVDSSFSAEQQQVIHGVFADWCEAVGYCPEPVLRAERGHVMLVDDLPEDGYTRRHCPEGRECVTSGTNSDGDRILVARNRPFADDLAALWYVVAHEVGHYCLKHLDKGLMAATALDDRAFEIDKTAIDGWNLRCSDF